MKDNERETLIRWQWKNFELTGEFSTLADLREIEEIFKDFFSTRAGVDVGGNELLCRDYFVGDFGDGREWEEWRNAKIELIGFMRPKS